MTEIINKIIGELEPGAFPSLPELLVRELETLDRGAGDADPGSLAAGDLFLTARLLADGGGTSARDIGRQLHQCATRMGFAGVPPARRRFLKQLYLQSTLTRALAEEIAGRVLPAAGDRDQCVREAGFCGLTLNIGALALEQAFGARYLDILQQTADTGALLEAERREFGADHAELGAAMMRHWGARGFSCDAVRYHHEGVDGILDATVLVRIAWLANQLADERVSPEAEVWADTLFELKADALSAIQAQAQAALSAATSTWHIAYTSTQYLPLPASDEDRVLEQEDGALRALRERAEADALFAPARALLAAARTPADLARAADEAVRQLFGDYRSLLFARTADGDVLACPGAAFAGPDAETLTIRCRPERSVIADSCLQRQAAFALPESGLSVIDRQVDTLLGAGNFCCEPCPATATGEAAGVLVVGVPAAQAGKYKKQKALRAMLGRELGRLLAGGQAAGTPQQDVASEYQRRIRETIHEVNNPLGIIKNYLQLLSMKQEDDAKAKSEISFIKSEIDRVGNILEALKQGPGPDARRPVNVNAVVRSLVGMFKGSLAAEQQITVDVVLDERLPEIVCSEDAIRQIVTNLVKNAAEALADGGTIQVTTAGNVYMDGTRYIEIAVTDDGPGIAADILDNLFASGHSTKGGGHTGSGLAIVNDLVKNLGGQVTCRSNSSGNPAQCDTASTEGTNFTVILPVKPLSGRSGDAQ